MKKIIRKAGALLLSASMIFGVAACEKSLPELERTIYEHEVPADGSTEKPIVISNDKLVLTLDPTTTAFDIEVKSTGQKWHSCAVNPDGDSVAQPEVRKTMGSMIVLEYGSEKGEKKTYGTQKYSVDNGFYKIDPVQEGDNSITVHYTIGELARTYFVPLVANEQEMADYLEPLTPSEQRGVKRLYRLLDIEKLEGDEKTKFLNTYPQLKDEKLYVLREETQPYLLEELEKTFEVLGFTEEDYRAQAKEYNISVDSGDKPTFNVTIKYILDGDSLLVEVPISEIRYPSSNPVTHLKVLPYFGCGSSSDEGFMFVPAGEGGIINFNNNKINQNLYYSAVYGWDMATYRNSVVNDNKVQMPVFGISNGGQSFICALEEGASYASIEADINRGRTNTRNYACANYVMVHSEKLDVDGKVSGDLFMYEQRLPQDETLRQRYLFCEEDGYVDMAKTYREYLQDKYPEYMKKQTEAKLPVTVDILGSIEILKQIAGIPTNTPQALTTYKEAAALIVDMADDNKWSDINVRYQGWFNGGVLNAAATEIRLIGALGGKSSLKKVISTAKDKGYDIYLDGEVQFVYGNKLFDGYSKNGDTAKLVNKEYVEIYNYSPVWFGEMKDRDYYLLARPLVTQKMMDKLSSYASKIGTDNYSFGSIGYALGADYNTKHPVSRDKSLQMQSEKIIEYKNNGAKILVDGGNMVPSIYADVLINVPVHDQQFSITDQSIPFYGMVFHGSKEIMGKAINLAPDYTYNLLASVENGCGLYFVFMDESTTTLQETYFTKYYGADYSKWKKDAQALYNKFSHDLGFTYNQYIVDHKVVQEGLNYVEYEDGSRVYVNYNSYDVTTDGVTVPAGSFTVKKGGN